MVKWVKIYNFFAFGSFSIVIIDLITDNSISRTRSACSSAAVNKRPKQASTQQAAPAKSTTITKSFSNLISNYFLICLEVEFPFSSGALNIRGWRLRKRLPTCIGSTWSAWADTSYLRIKRISPFHFSHSLVSVSEEVVNKMPCPGALPAV